MIQKAILILPGFLLSLNLEAQDYFERFSDLCAKRDTVGEITLLKEWEKSGQNDPELYTSYFNYFVQKSMHDAITLGNNPNGDNVLRVVDSAKTVGYIHGETYYEATNLRKGFEYINKGIALFPNRLDMRFGKIHMFGESHDYNAFTSEIVSTIQYAAQNKNNWQWTKNKSIDNPEQFFLGGIQDYVGILFNLGKGQAENIRTISQEVLKYYPKNIENLSNLSISYILTQDYDKALKHLLKAEKLSPNDGIILSNIAYVYMQMKRNQDAIAYYKKVVVVGEGDQKLFAEDQLKKLKPK